MTQSTPSPHTSTTHPTTVIEPVLEQLAAEGITYKEASESSGQFVVVALPDGSEITISGTSTRKHDVQTQHPPAEHESWQAAHTQRAGADVTVLYDSHQAALSFEDDTRALLDTVLSRIRATSPAAPGAAD
ncbi:hypothetical protein OHA27_37960 [Streptomyces sp. NBC_01619]|uniref:hypothetical protein n=1 Tax=Streptomyces sp. NBC_01619 TaxID=2975901 RepID=UPI002252A9AE|nr:hypothetical protein [Streptomyces sp. NBC_01619]MCX4515907.1 hypothetical protein [Streptomyces sp. NBC_01619]